ncbi:MAG: tripartite tricarboxylate transporter TctB family protein [Kiloniellaceae bacterium]
MRRINRDVVIAVFLLAMCGAFFWASFDIRQPDYGTLMPSTWPRAIVALFVVLSAIYLVQSLRRPAGEDRAERPPGLKAWLAYYRNPLWCYGLFLAFLVTLPVLGILIGGVLFVFCLLTGLGGARPRNLLSHAVIALVSVGAMWAVFTFALGVILPQGMIFTTL